MKFTQLLISNIKTKASKGSAKTVVDVEICTKDSFDNSFYNRVNGDPITNNAKTLRSTI